MNITVDCAKDCVNGCILGEKCPHQEYLAQTSEFIKETSLDKIIEMAEVARRKKLTEPPKWVIPDDF